LFLLKVLLSTVAFKKKKYRTKVMHTKALRKKTKFVFSVQTPYKAKLCKAFAAFGLQTKGLHEVLQSLGFGRTSKAFLKSCVSKIIWKHCFIAA